MADELSRDRPICVAVLAIGGQGGGVVTDWLVALAESRGWVAQSTSVPGVAQRTGATVYYVEMIEAGGQTPILALMPTPGDVDLVVAAEWMEAGRAIQRGLVSPDRTTLIASTHRSLAVSEKSVPGDGVNDPQAVEMAAALTAKRFLRADLSAIAQANGSVISASLFGSIAGSGALPFPRSAFEEAVRAGGLGVEASLRAFDAAYDCLDESAPEQADANEAPLPVLSGGTPAERQKYHALCERAGAYFPDSMKAILRAGLNRVVDYQDAAYGEDYLDRLEEIIDLDKRVGGNDKEHALTAFVAKYLASAMSYQDVIRVADLKSRSSRFARVRGDIAADEEQVVAITEFMHPRVQEICGLLPASLGRGAEENRFVRWLLSLFTGSKRVRSDSLRGFLSLYVLSALRRWRRKLLRHEIEMAHISRWLANVTRTANDDYDLAVEIVRCRRMIKGYSDTHERSMSKYDQVLQGIDLVRGRADAADWAQRLHEAALQDPDGVALAGALKTIESFSGPKSEVA
ncbi:indolepyruvate oxidoreductase subunit beta family protein [Pelagibius sp. Alg239-R121]|uniref:indolepyruvate oxidoreductase subunit beta family protein n=1 Tax=Pelagibius sp. Alg239-R121 TaxID=2993448 RepID=UPI0024A701B3|nr:indolepyruvate oxidoreductase subunit beta family protein [Pelagibius sp. Alg239-R121]